MDGSADPIIHIAEPPRQSVGTQEATADDPLALSKHLRGSKVTKSMTRLPLSVAGHRHHCLC